MVDDKSPLHSQPRLASPLPKLLPQLHERLHRSRARDPRVNQPAIFERAIVELPDPIRTQVRDPMTKLFDFFRAEDVRRFVAIAPPCHSGIQNRRMQTGRVAHFLAPLK